MSIENKDEIERIELGKKALSILEEIQVILKTDKFTEMDSEKLTQLYQELEKTTDAFGEKTYPLWFINKLTKDFFLNFKKNKKGI